MANKTTVQDPPWSEATSRLSLEIDSGRQSVGSRFSGSRRGRIDRNSPVPLYHQLYTLFLDKIQDGEWKPGEHIPPEVELVKRYRLSRVTLRQTLQQLVDDGYLFRQRGSGTFVKKPKARDAAGRGSSSADYLKSHIPNPSWRLLQVSRIKPSHKVAAALRIDETQTVLEFRRLLLADGEAIGLHIGYVPFPLADQIKEQDLTRGDNSLYYLVETLGLRLRETYRVIMAAPATAPQAKLLSTSAGSPLLQIERTSIGMDGRPVEFVQVVYVGDRFEYGVHLEHIAGS